MFNWLRRWLRPAPAPKSAAERHVDLLLSQLQPIGNEGLSLDAMLAAARGNLKPDQVARLRETVSPNNWQNLVDPFELSNDLSDLWYPMGPMQQVPLMLKNSLRGEVLPVYINELGLEIIRNWSRRTVMFNEWALNAIGNRKSYVVGKGFQYQAVLRKGPRRMEEDKDSPDSPEKNDLCRKVQYVIDEFLDRTAFGEREQEAVERFDRDGEAILRFFHIGNGKTTVRFVEPELMTDTTGQTHRQYGVVSEPEDIENVTAYSIVDDPNKGWVTEDVPAREVLHIKGNTGSNAKRGLPTLFPVRKNLERAEKLLRNMSIMGQVQATFAVIRKHKKFSPSSISAYQQGQADVNQVSPLSGRNLQLQQLFAGSIIDTSENTEYDFPSANMNAANLIQVLQAELRAVAARLIMPEWMLTIDASNNNFASALVAEAPGVKNFECLQEFFARRFGQGTYNEERVVGAIWVVIWNAVQYGKLPPEALTDIEIQVEGPSLVVRDKMRETGRFKILNEKGLLSLPSWAKQEGLDYDLEKKQGAGQPPPNPGPGGLPGAPPGLPPGPGANPPLPTPPGSAEGLTDPALQEHLQEAGFTGLDKHGHQWQDGKQVKRTDQQQGGHQKRQAQIAGVFAGVANRSANLSPQQKQDMARSSAKVISAMPPAALDRLSRGVKKIRFHASQKDLTASLMKEDAKLRDQMAGKNMVIKGSYFGKERSLDLNGPGTHEGKPASSHEYMAHEMTHAIDGPEHEFSRSQEWRNAWETEIKGGKVKIGKYATTSPAEGFAEVGRLLYSGKVKPEVIKQYLPKVYAFWAKHGLAS